MPSFDPQPKAQAFSAFDSHSTPAPPAAGQTIENLITDRVRHNAQFAMTAQLPVSVCMDVTNDGTDAAQMPPMLDQIEKSYGHRPETCLVDSAFATGDSVTGESVTGAGQQGTTVAGGIPRGRELEKKDIDPHTKQRGDTPESVEFRERMGTDEYRELFKQRPCLAEFPNAVCRNHGLRQFLVRGLEKVKAVSLWHAIAFNFRRMVTLGVFSKEPQTGPAT